MTSPGAQVAKITWLYLYLHYNSAFRNVQNESSRFGGLGFHLRLGFLQNAQPVVGSAFA